jgi:parallel beta-helix repeat protein
MKKLFTLPVLLFGILMTSFGQLEVSGFITTDSTWTAIDGPYTVTSNLQISASGNLTIEPGVEVKIRSNASIIVEGNLLANGITGNRILITSENPLGSKAKGDWNTIEVRTGGTASFSATTIEYGGYSTFNNSNYHQVYCNGGYIEFTNNCDIKESNNVGVRLNSNGLVEFSNTQITACRWPVVYKGSSNTIFDRDLVDISGNTFNGVFIDFQYLNTAMELDTIDIPYVFSRSLTVQSSGSLLVHAGNLVKMNDGTNIIVQGWLKANGSSDHNIDFTSYRNDNLGGDTNNDGAATPPASGDWGSIKFENSSNDAECGIYYTNFSFGGRGNRAPVWTQHASPSIQNCNFENNYIGAYIEFNSSPNFTNNTIGSSALVPFAMTLDASPTFTNNTFSFSDNQYDAIGIIGSTMTTSQTLIQRDVTGTPNVTYLLLGTVVIPEAISLTINPGIVIKGYTSSHRFVVKGTFIADGGSDANRITFTSAKDDNFGNPGDTNKDGTQTYPAIGNWGGIVFENTSDDASCLIRYSRLQYGSMPSVYYNTKHISQGQITLENASPTIENNIVKDCYYGVYAFQASHPEVHNNELTNTTYTPVAKSMNAHPVFSGNSFVNPGWTAIGIIGEDLGFDATLDKDNLAGYDNITYVLLSNLNINSGTYAEVENGVVLKFNNNTNITVEGGFRTLGLETDSVVFTSIKDDNYGVPRDTKNDGEAEAPAAGNWTTVRYTSTADDSYNIINYTRLLFGGNSNYGTVTYTDADGVISNSLISNSYYYGLRFDGVSNTACNDNVIIQNCRLDPIAMSLKSNPVMSFVSPDIASNGNGSNGILILEGTLSSSETLESRDVGGIYNIAYIVDQLTVGPNAIFTISPGVVIKFRDSYSSIIVNGALIADGTPEEKIVFTSIKDDSKGGDTNDDGNISTPQRNNWRHIVFNASALEAHNLLDNCILNYGGYTTGWNQGKNRSMIDIFDAYTEIDSTQIEHCNYGGIGIFGSADPHISNSQINNIGETPIIMSMFSEPTFHNNSVSNLGIVAIGVAEETYSLDDTIPQRDFADFENITYFLYRPLKVNSGTTIVVPKGTVFKNNGYSSFVVDGGLQVKGTEADPVVFTHLRDDDYGNPGDTNDNGSADSPSQIGNPVITFNDISIDDSCSVSNTIFRYARSGVNMEQAAPDIDSTLFEFCDWGVELRGVSTPAITHNTFSDLDYAPMVISLVSFPRDTVHNTISGSTYKAIGVLANEELVQDVTLTKNNFAGVRNIPYFFSGNYSIGTSVYLSIDPGVICKFNQGARLTVKRGLIAEGGATADSSIVFTDIKDDFFGGDTNANGSDNITSNYYNWKGILFTDESYDDSCRLDHCIIRYAGYGTTEAAISTAKASPSISNSSITYNSNGLRATGASNPTINYCDIFGSKYYGVQNVDLAHDIDATHNFWGSNSGPTHASNPGGTGDAITDRVLYDPFETNGFTHPLMGDVSRNGFIQAYDASLILQDVAGIISFDELQEQVGDVSGEAGITSYDAALVLQFVAGIIDAFPAEYLKSISTAPSANEQLEFSFEETTLNLSNSLTTHLWVNAGNGSLGFDMVLRYDPERLYLEEVINRSETAQMIYSCDAENGRIVLAFASPTTIIDTGQLASLQFTVLPGNDSETTLAFEQILANEQDVTDKGLEEKLILPITTIIPEMEIEEARLYDVYPNPADDYISFTFDVPDDNSPVSLSLYTADGRLLTSLFEGTRSKGRYSQTCSDIHHYKGLIIVKLRIKDQVFTQKVFVQP